MTRLLPWLLLAAACADPLGPRPAHQAPVVRFILVGGAGALDPPVVRRPPCPPGTVLWFWEETGDDAKILASGFVCLPPPTW